MVYQNMPDNFADTPLVGVKQYRQASLASGKPADSDRVKEDAGNPLYGGFLGTFRQAVLNGTLPQVPWIIPPAASFEHSGPSSPVQGAWYVQELPDALTANPDVWSKTCCSPTSTRTTATSTTCRLLRPSLEGQGGTLGKSTLAAGDMACEYYTHTPCAGTNMPPPDGECSSPGPRVPLGVIAPWSRGVWVTSQNFDHTSILRFLEARFSVKAPLISSCCRAVNFAPPNDATLATLAGRRSKVDADALPDFERRFAGRVETGRDGLSDPAMTAARGAAPPPPVPRMLVESAPPWHVRVAGRLHGSRPARPLHSRVPTPSCA